MCFTLGRRHNLYRYPEIMNRKIDLESLQSMTGPLQTRPVHLVYSRYVSRNQQKKIARVLKDSDLQHSLPIPGFEIHGLRQTAPD